MAIELLLVDAHVHMHQCFEERVFIDHALANLKIAADQRGAGSRWLGCLLLTEAPGEDAFARLRARVGHLRAPWAWRLSGEDCSLTLRQDGNDRLIAVAGRQIVSAGRVEVLALGTTSTVPDGQSLPETIAAVRAVGALPVLPWGFGKWLGRRGRLIAQQIAAARPGDLFLGDNGGRADWSLRPRLFRLAEARGITVLPGSDPLPLAQEVTKVGRYGFALQAPYDAAAPFAAIRRALAALAGSPEPFGRLEQWHSFVHRQMTMQLAKRWPARP